MDAKKLAIEMEKLISIARAVGDVWLTMDSGEVHVWGRETESVFHTGHRIRVGDCAPEGSGHQNDFSSCPFGIGGMGRGRGD